MTPSVDLGGLTGEQFRALELWILAAAHRAALTHISQGMRGDEGNYDRRREEALRALSASVLEDKS